MKLKSIFIVAVASLPLCSCLKDNKSNCAIVEGSPSITEVTNLRNYLTAKSISATEDPRGFFYNIVFAGTGSESPALTDSVEVTYRGTLTDGTVFDSTATGATIKYPLSGFITGWQAGLRLIKKNGVIDLYLPPAHGYGCKAVGAIPAGSITIFHVELRDF